MPRLRDEHRLLVAGNSDRVALASLLKGGYAKREGSHYRGKEIVEAALGRGVVRPEASRTVIGQVGPAEDRDRLLAVNLATSTARRQSDG